MKRPTLEIVLAALIVALGVWLAIDPRRGHDDAVPERVPQVASQRVRPPSPGAPVITAPGPDPSAPKVPRISVRDRSVLCVDTSCKRIARALDPRSQTTPHYTATSIAANARLQLGGLCTLTLAGELDCAGTAPLHVAITWGRSHAYLRDGDRLAWLASLDWAYPRNEPVQWMRAFPDGIDQLSIGYRIGCVLTRGHAVWCWSDPDKPRQMTVPAHVAEIAVVDPFVMCVRTEAGEVWCSPGRLPEWTACDPDSIACGTTVGEDAITNRFDPLTLVTEPLARVAVPPARRLVAAEYLVDLGNIELEHLYDPRASTCTVGEHGEVACFQTCGRQMSTYRVTGVAAREVRSDLELGYAVGEDGSLWTWVPPRTESCRASTVDATKTSLPAIVQLGDPLYHAGPYPEWETTRCAATSHGVRCWRVDRGKPLPLASFDPTPL